MSSRSETAGAAATGAAEHPAPAHTLREHWQGVLHWFRTRINNGILEGLNSLIQAAKAKARGYRSNRNLIAMAYLIAGKLDFKLLPT